MYFVTFPVAGTNIFPHANSVYGGQDVTEYNLRAREMVGTHPSIKYEVGPSYVHSADDFEIRIQQDDVGYVISYTSLEVLPGRAVINGHYVQTLNPMIVDMLEANATLKTQSKSPLKGELEIGIRAFYSTEPTMAGTLLVDNEEHMYLGIQLVVMPKGELVTPIDSPTDRNKVNCHLKLGSFTYLDGAIKSVTNYSEDKCQYVQADRIQNIDMLLSDTYLKKSQLNPKRLYTFSGKGTDSTGYDTWCDSTDSLMIWDKSPQRTLIKPSESEAAFGISLDDRVILTMPHKQVDGMVDEKGNREYYKSKSIALPVANYELNTAGTVDRNYTKHIKDITEKFNLFHQTVKGTQVYYMDIKDSDENTLPTINQSWNVGDYVLVNQDYTVDASGDQVRAPSTIYVILPGDVTGVAFAAKVEDSSEVPSSITGCELDTVEWESSTEPTMEELYSMFLPEEDKFKGRVGLDYFVVHQTTEEGKSIYLYYKVTSAGKKSYSEALFITGEIPLAQESVIGGFLNVPEDTLDGGYVYRDENGYLRLLDYNLLRTGVLAYQLGEDIYLESGLTSEEIQAYLDEYVNDRVAFPNATHILNASNSNIIDIDIYLSAEDDKNEINIYNIDSRFNTAVRVNILGDATSTTTVNFINCQKLIISNNISGSPIINVYRSCLYYDASLFNYIRTCRTDTTSTGFQDLKLWYEMLDSTDPNLVVDGMTVSELDAPIVAEDIDFWNETVLNDNHYRYALHSITFSGDSTIVGCSMLVGNETTANIQPGHHIMSGSFELPQGSGLVYPKACVTRQLKITGTFVSCYKSDVWVVTDTMFTALTNTYDPFELTEVLSGNIAFHANTNLISSNVDVEDDAECIPGWEPDTYHIFSGGVLY